MKIISHRGNLAGADSGLENSPPYILTALNVGFDVEVDLWGINGSFTNVFRTFRDW